MASRFCELCSRDMTDLNYQGRQTHTGICKKKREGRCAPPTLAVDHVEVEDEEMQGAAAVGGEHEGQEISGAGASGGESTNEERQLTAADEALLRMFYERSDVKASLLKDVIAILRMPERLTFINSQQFLSFIDSLPGPEFSSTAIVIPEGMLQYTLHSRDILDIVTALIARFNGSFWDPSSSREVDDGLVDFADGTRFKQLNAKLAECAGPDAVLVPLVLSSGAQLPRFYLFDVVKS